MVVTAFFKFCGRFFLYPLCNIQCSPPSRLSETFIKDCAYFIAGVADPKLKWHMVDITISFSHFTLQAVELGYGTCWIGAFDENQVKQVLKIPEDKKVVICMTFGMPKGKHVPRGRKAVEEFIYLNRYSERIPRSLLRGASINSAVTSNRGENKSP